MNTEVVLGIVGTVAAVFLGLVKLALPRINRAKSDPPPPLTMATAGGYPPPPRPALPSTADGSGAYDALGDTSRHEAITAGAAQAALNRDRIDDLRLHVEATRKADLDHLERRFELWAKGTRASFEMHARETGEALERHAAESRKQIAELRKDTSDQFGSVLRALGRLEGKAGK